MGLKDKYSLKKPFVVKLVTKDSNGNKLKSGDLPVTVMVIGSTDDDAVEYPVKVKDLKNGEYDIRVTPVCSGLMEMTVNIGEDSISGSPFMDIPVNDDGVDEKKPTDPSRCEVENLEPTAEGCPSTFDIVSKDADGELQSQGGDNFEVDIVGPNKESIPVKVEDKEDGEYTVHFTPQAIGKAVATIKLDGKPVGKSTYPIFIKPPSSLKYSISGPGVRTSELSPNPISFKFMINDDKSKPISVPMDCFGATIKDPSGAIIKHDTKHTQPNEFEVSYLPTTVGDHLVSVDLFGSDALGKPLKVAIIPCKESSKLGTVPSESGSVEIPQDGVKFSISDIGVPNLRYESLSFDLLVTDNNGTPLETYNKDEWQQSN